MKRDTEDAAGESGEQIQRVPVHCPYCGSLLVYFSSTSHADLEMRCPNCRNDYSITLREEMTAMKQKRKSAVQAAAGR